MLVHFGRHVLEVIAFSRALNESKFALTKLVIVDLINNEFLTASVVRAANNSLIIHFGRQ